MAEFAQSKELFHCYRYLNQRQTIIPAIPCFRYLYIYFRKDFLYFILYLTLLSDTSSAKNQHWPIQNCQTNLSWTILKTHAWKVFHCSLKAAKYETQKPSTWRATLFRCKFWSMFPVFHLARSTCRATKTFVAGWRKLLRKVERGSTLCNKFWLCCSFFIKLATWHATNLLAFGKSTNQSAAFLRPATNVSVADQVDHARWKTGNIDQNLQRNNVARQVEDFCISYFVALKERQYQIWMIDCKDYLPNWSLILYSRIPINVDQDK